MKTFSHRTIAALTALLLFPSVVTACEVCVGNPDDPQTKGMQAAILTLLIITYCLLMAIIGFFVYLRFRNRQPMVADINQVRST